VAETIILDTNVISALMGPLLVEPVLNWFNGLPLSSFRTTAINEAEIRYGIARLPEGRRRREIALLAEGFLFSILDPLPFDHLAAMRYAEIASGTEKAGFQIDVPDIQIAAIAASRGFSIATRNEKHFLLCGVTVVNPWLA
jgi:predicted nucleic acid-binding protein